MGEARNLGDGIQLKTTEWYHPAPNGIAERTIRVLTNAVCAIRGFLNSSGAFSTATYVHNRTSMKSLMDVHRTRAVLYGEKRTFPTSAPLVHHHGHRRAERALEKQKLEDWATMRWTRGWVVVGRG
jgi:hypothetical protein